MTDVEAQISADEALARRIQVWRRAWCLSHLRRENEIPSSSCSSSSSLSTAVFLNLTLGFVFASSLPVFASHAHGHDGIASALPLLKALCFVADGNHRHERTQVLGDHAPVHRGLALFILSTSRSSNLRCVQAGAAAAADLTTCQTQRLQLHIVAHQHTQHVPQPVRPAWCFAQPAQSRGLSPSSTPTRFPDLNCFCKRS